MKSVFSKISKGVQKSILKKKKSKKYSIIPSTELCYENGDHYEGETTKEDLRNGFGVYIFTSGDTYEGEYKNNNKHGSGTYTFAHGDKYSGEFKRNKKHGIGEYYFAKSHKTVVGRWVKDKLVETIQEIKHVGY